MKNRNYITIQGWMINELKLSGNELICYALIYGFSQDGESIFKGSLSYISEALNVSKENARLILKRLCEKEYLIKIDEMINSIKFCSYCLNNTIFDGGIETTTGVALKQRRGGIETTPNNTNDNYKEIIKKKNNNIEDWRIDFNAYLKLIDEAREIILKDEEFKSQCIKFNPNMDFDLTLEKMIVTYWGTETGWNKKKASKGKSINMLSTLKKGFDNRFNIVYKQYQYSKKNKSTDKDVPMPKNYTRVPLHPALSFTDNEGLLNDGTFVKDGYRFYFSKTQGKAIGIPPAADPMPNDGDYDYNLNNGWYQID